MPKYYLGDLGNKLSQFVPSWTLIMQGPQLVQDNAGENQEHLKKRKEVQNSEVSSTTTTGFVDSADDFDNSDG